MDARDLSLQLRSARDRLGLTDWELARRSNVRVSLVGTAVKAVENVPVGVLLRIAYALGLEVALSEGQPTRRQVSDVPSVVDLAVARVAPDNIVRVSLPSWVLILGVEGTLVSNDESILPRPGLHRFLTCARPLFSCIEVFTMMREDRFREMARRMVMEAAAPEWFPNVEQVNWSKPLEDVSFKPSTDATRVLLVDYSDQYLSPSHRAQWVPISRYCPPFDPDDKELDRILEELVRRTNSAPHGRVR